jgi:XTP/dITP diphosphohydrolase
LSERGDAPKLLIASNNEGKVRELRELLQGCGWQILSPRQLGLDLEVEESGRSYAENARLKAEAFRDASGLAALADDSGLEVDALGGEPGALHHQHGWDGRDQADRIRLLLDALKDVPTTARSARYRAVISLALPDGRVLEEEGVCEGVISLAPAGAGGFGYDPVFHLPERGKTMAQLEASEKNQISHRAMAAARMRERLKDLTP